MPVFFYFKLVNIDLDVAHGRCMADVGPGVWAVKATCTESGLNALVVTLVRQKQHFRQANFPAEGWLAGALIAVEFDMNVGP